MADRSQTSTGLSVYVYGGLHKVLTLPAIFLLAQTNSVMFLNILKICATILLTINLMCNIPKTLEETKVKSC